MAQHASTAVKMAALALAAPALLLPMKAAAQQVASTDLPKPDYSVCDAMSRTNPGGAIKCRVDALNANTEQLRQIGERARRDGAAARQEGAVARQQAAIAEEEGGCVDKIKAEMAAGRISADAVRAKLNGRKTREVGACNLLGMLTRS